jgi:hypothetical protein
MHQNVTIIIEVLCCGAWEAGSLSIKYHKVSNNIAHHVNWIDSWYL